MTLISLLALPICIELAGWLVDATFVKRVLKEQSDSPAED
jgi:hypothetical protein